MKDFTFEVRKGRAHSSGVCFGYGDSDPYVIARGKHHVLLRTPSVRDWSAVGCSDTYPAEWTLCQVKWLEPEKFRVIKVVLELTPGRKWKKAKSELLELMEKEERKEIINDSQGTDGR